MNTLKMKVLLILANRPLGWSLMNSVLIWVTTCLVGTAIVFAIGYELPSVSVFILSLTFSSPALFLSVPSLYFLPSIQTIRARILFSLFAIFTACTVIIGIVAMFFNFDYWMVAQALFPFVPSAIVSFFIIVRKQIVKSYSYKTT